MQTCMHAYIEMVLAGVYVQSGQLDDCEELSRKQQIHGGRFVPVHVINNAEELPENACIC